jgi:hypothetical protein
MKHFKIQVLYYNTNMNTTILQLDNGTKTVNSLSGYSSNIYDSKISYIG